MCKGIIHILVSTCLLAAACVSNDVPASTGGSGGFSGRGGNSGGFIDASLDVSNDTSDEVSKDSRSNVSNDFSVDASIDSFNDASVDASMEASREAGTAIGDSGKTVDAGDAGVNGWTLVWSDEFSANQIDSSHWSHEVNCWGGGNNEQECYVAEAKNSFVKDGFLNIVTIADNPSGTVYGPDNDPTVVSKPYSSARLNTKGVGGWKYGRIEVRAKLPFGQGLWPAIWMLSVDSVYGSWARSGEIDIAEAINLGPGNNRVYGTLHYGGAWPDNVQSGTSYDLAANVWETLHTYAIEWEQGEIRWFVDEKHYATQQTWYSKGNPYPAPFDQPFYVLLNVAVGGAWPGPPNAQTSFPQTMQIDYVRVYQCSRDPSTGKGCGSNDSSVVPLSGVSGP